MAGVTERTMTIYLEQDQMRYWWTWKVDKTLMDDLVQIIRAGAALQEKPFRIEFIEQRLTDYPMFVEETE